MYIRTYLTRHPPPKIIFSLSLSRYATDYLSCTVLAFICCIVFSEVIESTVSDPDPQDLHLDPHIKMLIWIQLGGGGQFVLSQKQDFFKANR
jgi:hypothetical protein